MSAVATPHPMTTAELLAMPDDGVARWLIEGRLWEKRGDDVTKRNRWHSGTEARIAYLLWQWLERQPGPRGWIHSGEVGCILRHDPDTTVGIDVAYFSHDVAFRETDQTTLIDGPPILAVEILSPSDTIEEIDAKVNQYLAAGVALVWVVHPRRRTVTVHRPGAEPELFNATQELSGEPHLPGFRVPVASLFV